VLLAVNLGDIEVVTAKIGADAAVDQPRQREGADLLLAAVRRPM